MTKQKQNGIGVVAVIAVASGVFAASSMQAYAAQVTKKEVVTASQGAVTQGKSAKLQTKPTTSVDDVSNDTVAETGDDSDNYSHKDPLEKMNRVFFTFNDTLDTYLIKPVAELYNKIMPKPLNKGIHNAFNNVDTLITIVNDLLQLNLYQMTNDVARFGINTTLGIGGLFDMATRMHLPYFQNDFGLTLARWGYKNSSYLVIPFLGSSTIRDGIGIPVDYFEFSVYPRIQPQETRFGVLGLFVVDHRANLLQIESVLEEAAVDKYAFMRNAYLQNRAYKIEQINHIGYADRASDEPVADSVETAPDAMKAEPESAQPDENK